jgi:hypothetical protein
MHPPSPFVFVAHTFRCQDATNRLTILFKAQEGAPALLQAYIVPAAPLVQTCAVVQYRCVCSLAPGGGAWGARGRLGA